MTHRSFLHKLPLQVKSIEGFSGHRNSLRVGDLNSPPALKAHEDVLGLTAVFQTRDSFVIG